MMHGLLSRKLLILVFFMHLCLLWMFVSGPGPQAFAEQPEMEKAEFIKKAAVYSEDSNTDNLIRNVREALVTSPDRAEDHDQLGYLLIKKGLYDEALDSFRTALKINPNLRTAKTGIGVALLGKGDAAAAETALKSALILNPYPAMTYYALGLTYLKMDNNEQAAQYFKEGIRTFKDGKK